MKIKVFENEYISPDMSFRDVEEWLSKTKGIEIIFINNMLEQGFGQTTTVITIIYYIEVYP